MKTILKKIILLLHLSHFCSMYPSYHLIKKNDSNVLKKHINNIKNNTLAAISFFIGSCIMKNKCNKLRITIRRYLFFKSFVLAELKNNPNDNRLKTLYAKYIIESKKNIDSYARTYIAQKGLFLLSIFYLYKITSPIILEMKDTLCKLI